MNKELYQIWKRFVSLILSICLTVGLGLSQLAVVAYASTELPNENLGNGASEGTAYAWIGPRGGTGEIPVPAHTASICADCRQDRRNIAKAGLRHLLAGRGMPPIYRWITEQSIRPTEVRTALWKT